MIKQLSTFALLAALAVPMSWAADRSQRSAAEPRSVTTRAPYPESTRAIAGARAQGTAISERSKSVKNRSASGAQQAGTPQAPGVTQINIFDSTREAYFVVTRTIPQGSKIQAFIIPPAWTEDELQSWALAPLTATDDLPPGTWFQLPFLGLVGHFWEHGLTTYKVVVTEPDGESMSRTDFVANPPQRFLPDSVDKPYFRDATDTDMMVPRIDSSKEYLDGDATILEIKGKFLTDTLTYVVFSSIVAPQDTIQVVDSETIRVNLSNVPDFDRSTMKYYLLTVGQDSWADSYPFHHVPR